ncbi:MAG: hypothetical protein WC197_03190 [Candidatus Gastranaerophilaceae bacterium]|jgi:Spy/CpxP family protein refolding chaperone
MKKTAFNLLAIAGIVTIMQIPVLAQTSSTTDTAGCPPCKIQKHHYDMQKHGEFLTKKLNLSPTQQQQWKTIREEEIAKLKAIKEESFKKLEAILTPAQKTQLQQLKKEKYEKWTKKHKEFNEKMQNCPVKKSPAGAQ